VIIDHLLEKNDVTIFTSDRAYQYLSRKYDDVYEIEGFNTVYEENEVQYRRTFYKKY